ncbi:MAG: gas vesicle protein [Methanothrix sp.]
MQPIRNTNAGLVDLLDRVLDKGLVLNADVLISVAGVPLLGLNLKAALAGMDTMIKYGIWEDWDVAQRAWAIEERRRKLLDGPLLLEGEEIRLKTFGSHWYSKGIYRNWRPGYIYITNQRIFSYRRMPAEVLFNVHYGDIQGFTMERKKNIATNSTDYLCIILKNGEIEKVHPDDAYAVKDAVVNEMNRLGLSFDEMSVQAIDEETETCPTCGTRAPVQKLLTEGCTKCGWVSTRTRKLVV